MLNLFSFVSFSQQIECTGSTSIQFNKIVNAANEAYNSKDYIKAKELYSRVIILNPNDRLISKKLRKINRKLHTSE